jgi:beta-lactamase class A
MHRVSAATRIGGTAVSTHEGALVTDLATTFEQAGVDGFLHALDLSNGNAVGHQDDQPVIPASVFKVPVLLELCRQHDAGEIDATAPVQVPVEGRAPGPFGMSVMADPMTMSLRDLAWLMMGISDNAATDVICEHVGLDNVNKTLASLGLLDTTISGDCRDLFASMLEDLGLDSFEALTEPLTPEVAAGLRDLDPQRASTRTTPRDTTRLLQLVWADEAASAAACAETRRILNLQVWPHRLASGFADLDDVITGGKTGTLPGIRNEVGVVEYPDGGRYAVAVFTRSTRLTKKDAAADAVIGRAARLAVDELRARA